MFFFKYQQYRNINKKFNFSEEGEKWPPGDKGAPNHKFLS